MIEGGAGSPFLERSSLDWIASNDLAFAIWDGFPVSPGHALVIPKRVVPTWFEASVEEQQALMALVAVVKERLDRELRPDGYNIGINVGAAGGQTVFHLHVHVIPRFHGDMDDPRGGVRHVIPWAGNYKKSGVPRIATGDADPFLAHLVDPFVEASDIAIVAAFAQDSGLVSLYEHVLSAKKRGARLRLLTGDYLDITEPRALRRLLAWTGGTLECRVFEAVGRQAFHPKAWRFESERRGVAFVGSSNISRSALGRGIEWNLRIERDEDRPGWRHIVDSFEALWIQARPLSAEWIDTYEIRWQAREQRGGVDKVLGGWEPPIEPPTPHDIQVEALAALAKTREDGRQRALVVLATGLGKTWLAAFDVAAMANDMSRPPRVLFVAHRSEILGQAAQTFGAMLSRRWSQLTIDFCAGASDGLDADVVLASVQKVSRDHWLDELAKRRWDYVVVDEVHHATADSYRRVLARLDAGFVLGLTATPDRQDEGDVLGLFDDHLAYRADLDRGIDEGFLSPFKYLGLRDTEDYADIPWRNRRFDPDVLAKAVQTERRMEKLWEAWEAHPGSRTLVFCASIAHAEFAGQWLSGRGVRVEVLHSGEGSADRNLAIAKLRQGDLDALVTVDLFNEGVDIPSVDRVAMLRPTESPIVFLQQLGRGLRRAPGKAWVTVIDFVGNHSVFLDRVGRMLSFGAKHPWTVMRAFLGGGQVELPLGCSIDIELEAIDLLRKLVPVGRTQFEQTYRELRATARTRPTLGELYRLGLSPQTVRGREWGWFDFVSRETDLSEIEKSTLERCREWFRELETSAMSKCFKMVVLEVLLDADALGSGMELDELAARSYAVIARSPELRFDIAGVKPLGDRPTAAAWRSYWRKNPIAAWTSGDFFEVADRNGTPHLLPRFAAPEGGESALAAMTRELVDYKMAQYRRRVVRGAKAVEAEVIDLTAWRKMRAYPSLKAAAGAVGEGVMAVEGDEVMVDGSGEWTDDPGVFLVRVSGDSMEGGRRPIRDGDWVVLRGCRGLGLGALDGKVALVQVPDAVDGHAWLLKRVVGGDGGWTLRSDNNARPSYAATAEVEPVAVLVEVLAPERVRAVTD